MPTKPTTPTTAPGLQPWLHDLVTTLSAPTTALSEASGQIRAHGAQGVLHCDIRVLSTALLRIGGEEPTPIGGGALSAGKARFTAVPRGLGGNGADPAVRVERSRTVRPGEFAEEIALSSVAAETIPAEVTLELAADLARIETVRAGRPASRPSSLDASHWGDDDVQVTLSAPGAEIRPGDPLTLKWAVEIPAGGTVTLNWHLTATTDTAPVTGVGDRSVPSLAHTPTATADDPRLPALLKASWSDLTALSMAPADDPDAVFLAAGSPWYFTLFGRDSLWAARFLLPFGTDLAEGTLRALAARQGTSVNIETAEEPGKIPHELRAKATELPHGSDSGAMTLPPLYYGTIDATPLWICLLYDAWR